MPTDDERRAVARRLRECRGGWSSGSCYYTIINAMGLPDTSREDGGHALYAALADLIDPDCDEGRYSVARTARPVDRDALLALADEMEQAGKDYRYQMVENACCDNLINDAPDDFIGYARRIREACGEVVE